MRTDQVLRRFGFAATAALFFVFLSSPLIFGAENARPIASLTMDQRKSLPGNTQATLPSGRTVTLEALREEHRAHEESIAHAAALGRAFAARIAMPALQTLPAANAQAATLAPPQPVTRTGGAGFRTAAIAPDPKTISVASNGRNVNGGAGGPVNRNNGKLMVGPETFARGFLVPLPVYPNQPHPVPVDYYAFCRAVGASVCVYLPANLTYEQFAGELEAYPDWLTDAATCANEGGEWIQEHCRYYYFEGSGAYFTPGASVSSVESCDPGSKYAIYANKGYVMASYPPVMEEDNFSLRNPVTCVVQVWVVPWP